MAISRLQYRDFSRDQLEISKSNLEFNKYSKYALLIINSKLVLFFLFSTANYKPKNSNLIYEQIKSITFDAARFFYVIFMT